MFVEEKSTVYFQGVEYTTWHGSPFDRGSADSYYHRGAKPHWWPEGTGRGECITEERMSLAEIEAYFAGYDHNERYGGKKEW
jgi:hypothetical protein